MIRTHNLFVNCTVWKCSWVCLCYTWGMQTTAKSIIITRYSIDRSITCIDMLVSRVVWHITLGFTMLCCIFVLLHRYCTQRESPSLCYAHVAMCIKNVQHSEYPPKHPESSFTHSIVFCWTSTLGGGPHTHKRNAILLLSCARYACGIRDLRDF